MAKDSAEPGKGELRRERLLDAAAECFRKEGFHGSSIARISQMAGMSPGHIYHFFASKEEIVEAIAEREEHELAEILRRMEQDRDGGDLADRLIRQVPDTIARNGDPSRVGLSLELAAEAARNPAVRDILQRSYGSVRQQCLPQARRMGVPEGIDDAELRLRMSAINALFHGVTLQGVVDPMPDKEGMARLISQVVRFILDDAD